MVVPAVPVPTATIVPIDAPRARKVNPIKLRQMEDRLKFVEVEIPRLEAAIALTEGQMAEYTSAEETQRLAGHLSKLRVDHEKLSAEWEDLVAQVEEQTAG